MAPAQAIQMADGSTLALNPCVFRVLDNGTVSMVDPPIGNLNAVGTPPKSTMVSSVEPSKVRVNDDSRDKLKLSIVCHD